MTDSLSDFGTNPFNNGSLEQPQFSFNGSNFLASNMSDKFMTSGQDLHAMLDQDEKKFEELSAASSKVYDISCFSNAVAKSGMTVGASMLDSDNSSLLGKHVSIGEYLGRRTKPLGSLEHRSYNRPSFGIPVKSPRRYEEPSMAEERPPNITDSAWIDSIPSLSESTMPEKVRSAPEQSKLAPASTFNQPKPSRSYTASVGGNATPWASLNSSDGKVESWLRGSISSTEDFLQNLALDRPKSSINPQNQPSTSLSPSPPPSEADKPRSTASPKKSVASSANSVSTVRHNEKTHQPVQEKTLDLTWQSDEVHSSTKSGSEDDSDSRQADFRTQPSALLPVALLAEPLTLAKTYQDLESMINLYRDSNGSDTPGLVEKVKQYYAQNGTALPTGKAEENLKRPKSVENIKQRVSSLPNHSTPNENKSVARMQSLAIKDSLNPSIGPLQDKTNDIDWLSKVPKPISKPKTMIRSQDVKLESKTSCLYWRGADSACQQDVVIRNASHVDTITVYAYIKNSQAFQIADCNMRNNIKLVLAPREEKSVKVSFLPPSAQVYEDKVSFCPKADRSTSAARVKFMVDLKGYAGTGNVQMIQSDTIQLKLDKSQLSGSVVLQNVGNSPSFVKILGFWDEEHSLTVKTSLLTIYPSQIVLRANERKVVQVLAHSEAWDGQRLHIVAVWGDEPARQQLISYVRQGNKPNIPQSSLLEAIDFTTPFEGEMQGNPYKNLWKPISEDIQYFYDHLKLTRATVHLPDNPKEDSAFLTMTAEHTLAVALEDTRDTTFMSEILSSGDLMDNRVSGFKRNSRAAGKVCAQVNVLQFPATRLGEVVTVKLPLHNWATVTKKVTLSGLTSPFLTKHLDHVMKPMCYAKIPIHFCPENSGQFSVELKIKVENQEDLVAVELVGEAY